MSWSVSAQGKVRGVQRALDDQFRTHGVCKEPEETIRQLACTAIMNSLQQMHESTAVSVAANGSMQFPSQINNLMIDIKPLYGFFE